jgi:tetratricopeptide (TPR) repeat protein
VLAGAGQVPAQESGLDRVVLQLKGSSSRIALTCTVIDYTGEKITVRTKNGAQVRSFEASEVFEVRTPQTEQHVKGLVSYARGDIEQAVASFQRALATETRGWVRRDILALLVRCALRRGNYATAGSKFLALWESDPRTWHVKLVPLTWSPSKLDAPLRSEALGWIYRGNEMSKLLGASHLLNDARKGSLAERELRDLATSIDRRIRLLARAQLWRLRLREGNLSPAELRRWQSRIGDLPEDIRGGPYYLLGRAHLGRKEYDRAAMALLWVPLVYDHDVPLAARACLEAAESLNNIGQSREAVALYREVTTRFAGTVYADEAAAVLKSISTGKKSARE